MEKPLKNNFSRNRIIFTATIAAYAVLALIVSLFNIEFSSFKVTDMSAPVWYFITMSGGVYGGVIIILLSLIYLALNFRKFKRRHRDIYIFIGILTTVQIIAAGASLYYVKDFFQSYRPSQLYLTENGVIDNRNEFTKLSIAEKRIYLQHKIDTSKNFIKEIYPPILESWIYESGFSFPSGHSQTAFFIGPLVAYMMYRTTKKKFYFIIPLIWAVLVPISRVVIGIHYPADVLAGAALGMCLSFIVISLKSVNRIFN